MKRIGILWGTFYTKHGKYLYLRSKKNEGKKKNFLLQEMNREINTIGSKSDNTKIKHFVVDIKNNLEKLREQVQNIL